MNPMSGSRAVVIGASMGGLLAARVLSNHFKEVILIEKDVVEDSPVVRRGQSQAEHLHGILAKGLNIFESYFPELTQELVENDATYEDMGAAIRWYQFGGYRKNFESGLWGVTLSRPLLEYIMRRRVLGIPAIKLVDRTSVDRLRFENGKVAGVQTSTTDSSQIKYKESELRADLVVDCSGRSGRSTRWLLDGGYDAPQKSEI